MPCSIIQLSTGIYTKSTCLYIRIGVYYIHKQGTKHMTTATQQKYNVVNVICPKCGDPDTCVLYVEDHEFAGIYDCSLCDYSEACAHDGEVYSREVTGVSYEHQDSYDSTTDFCATCGQDIETDYSKYDYTDEE